MLLRVTRQSLPNRIPLGPLGIDRGHPLATGLIGAFAPGSVNGRNIAGTEILTPDTGAVFSANVEGRGHVSTAANGGLLTTATAPFKNWADGFSLYWRGILHGNRIGGNASLIAVDYDTSANNPFVVAGIYQQGAVGVPQIALFWNFGGVFAATASPFNLTVGKLGSLAGTFGANASASLYSDGLMVAQDTFGAAAPTSDPTSQITVGTFGGIQSRSSNATTFLAYVWNRLLTAAEVASLERGPYDLLTSEDSIMPWWLNSISAPGSFQPAWAVNSNTVIQPGARMG